DTGGLVRISVGPGLRILQTVETRNDQAAAEARLPRVFRIDSRKGPRQQQALFLLQRLQTGKMVRTSRLAAIQRFSHIGGHDDVPHDGQLLMQWEAHEDNAVDAWRSVLS